MKKNRKNGKRDMGYTFPLLILIIARYLFYFHYELKIWLNLEDTKIIKALISAFFSMGLVGLFLTTLKYETFLSFG